MSKLAILKAFLSDPKGIVTLGYSAMLQRKKNIPYEKIVKEKFGIDKLPVIDLLDLCPGFHESMDAYSFLKDTSLVSDILMIKALAKKFKECSYLEIGSFRGESIAAIADVARDCTSITLSADEMRAMRFPEGYITSHAVYSKDKRNVTTWHENSQTFDYGKLNGKKFDLIFVDGDHTYNGVVIDTKNVFSLLKNEESIIVWHDYGFSTEEIRHEVMAAILEGTPVHYRKNLYHVSNTMCAIFARGNYPTSELQPLAIPNKGFRVEVEAYKI